MTLENEIKQIKPFSSKKEKAIVNVIFTSNWLFAIQNRLLKPFDLSIQQYNVLRILNGQNDNPITINQIIDRMLDKTSNASRLVDKLVIKGFVRRDQKETNRRACDVLITELGKKFLLNVKSKLTTLEDEIGNISEEELEILNNLLDAFRKKVNYSNSKKLFI